MTVVLAGGPPLSTADGIRVVTASTSEALAAVHAHRADVVVIDPDTAQGIEAIRTAARATAVLVLANRSDDASVRAAIRAGARGYLVNDADRAGFAHAVRAVAAGNIVFGASIAGRIAGLFAEPYGALTVREREILDLLRAGLSPAAIAARLRLAPKTVRNNLSAIFAKVDVPRTTSR